MTGKSKADELRKLPRGDHSEDLDRACVFIRDLEAQLAAKDQRIEELEHNLEEREHDIHMRIRAGYDKTVADTWRARAADLERERDEARRMYCEERAVVLGYGFRPEDIAPLLDWPLWGLARPPVL